MKSRYFHVSIPHRYCKNCISHMNGEPSLYVSIPHRYCKNDNKLYVIDKIDRLFQFLIGTVKTQE